MARPHSSPFLLLAFLVPFALAGCSAPAAERPNVLHDAGFEEGGRGWDWIPSSPAWLHNFSVAEEGRTGNRSLWLDVRDAPDQPVGIVGAVQNLTRDEVPGVPRHLRGWYHVDEWEAGAKKTYIQVVLGLQPAEGQGEPVCAYGVDRADAAMAPCQLAYVLGGIDEDPFQIANRQFVFLERDAPQTGAWVRFEASPRADYEREWGDVGEFAQLRLYVEARYEFEEGEERRPVNVSVRWDDLYLG